MEFSTTVEWTAPSVQRSHLGRSRVSCAPPRQEPPAPTSPTGSVPTGFTYNHAGGREQREGPTNPKYPVVGSISKEKKERKEKREKKKRRRRKKTENRQTECEAAQSIRAKRNCP